MVRSKTGSLNLHQIHAAILPSFSAVKHVFLPPLCLKLHFFIETCIWLFICKRKLPGSPAFAENVLFSSILWYLHATFPYRSSRDQKKTTNQKPQLNIVKKLLLALKKYEVFKPTKLKTNKSVLRILAIIFFSKLEVFHEVLTPFI